MFDKFRMIFFKHLVIAAAFFSVTNASFAYSTIQEVYLADEPLPKIVAKLQNQGMSEKQIIVHLKHNLQPVTPELAKEKFNIKWLENNVNPVIENEKIIYPAVAICYMGPKVGYGLFALDSIQKGALIVEYAGKLITDKKLYKPNSYTANADDNGKLEFAVIDASAEGNAARFANHLLTEKGLSDFQYEIPGWFTSAPMSKDTTAIANSVLTLIYLDDAKKDKCIGLTSTVDIKPYEQIGFSYDASYGYEGSTWAEEPYLFDKDGEVISPDTYKIVNQGVLFHDELTQQYITIYRKPNNYLGVLPFGVVGRNYGVFRFADLKIKGQITLVCNYDSFLNKIATPRSRVGISCYQIKSDTAKFLIILGLVERFIDEEKLSEDKKIEILKAADDSNYARVYGLLGEYAADVKRLVEQIDSRAKKTAKSKEL